MEERWVIPLAIATMAGFLLGLLGAILQLTGGSALAIAATGIVASTLAAAASVIGCEREGLEVAALRALFASLLFLGIFLAMQAFLRDGRPFVALLWAVFAGVMAGMVVRSREPRKPRDERGAQPA